jgi:hypothetical protein
MKKNVTIFFLIIFLLTFSNYSHVMLSIEEGRVFFEPFSICHIIESQQDLMTGGPDNKQPLLGTKTKCCHQHVQITHNSLSKTFDVLSCPEVKYLSQARITPLSIASATPPPINLSANGQLKRPLSILPQTSILLI